MPHLVLDGIELWYEDSGGAGVPVVFVHGSQTTSESWAGQLPDFTAAGYRCLTYDLRGFGRSRSRRESTPVASITDDLEALVRGLALPQFVLVGHASGGFGALEFALDNPGRLLALVVSSSLCGISDPEFHELRARLTGGRLEALSVAERTLGRSYRAEEPEGVARFLEIHARSHHDSASLQRTRRPLTFGRLATLRLPVLLIGGEEDLPVPPPLMQAVAGRIPGCSLQVLTGAGHYAYWEQPRTWNECVLAFLQRRVAREEG